MTSLQGVIGAFYGLPAVPVEADVGRESRFAASGVASFFSGGVDSFFTAMRRDDIEFLIFVHGFDIDLVDKRLRRAASQAVGRAAAEMGKSLIEVTTDLRASRAISDRWDSYHGAAMASVAHLLAPIIGRVYVPASYTFRDAFPWGSHPMLDHLWSGDGVEFIHDGAEVTRFEKIAAIAHDPSAQRHLRVCWENPGGAYNCGRCEKCTRTMVALRAQGALERFGTFDVPLDLKRMRFGSLTSSSEVFARQTLAQLEQAGTDPELASILRVRLRVGPMRHRIEMLWRRVKSRLRSVVGPSFGRRSR